MPLSGVLALVLVAVLVGLGVGHQTWHDAGAAGGGTAGGLGGNALGGNGFAPFGGFGPGGGSGAGSGSSTVQGAGAPADVSAIAAKVSPAVVDIDDTFGYQGAAGAGTGIVLTSSGLVLTNNHVIDGETKLSATDVGNGKTYSAVVVGYDASKDVALIQLQGASGLATARLAAAAPRTGEPVVAIGNAGGAGGTPSNAGGSVTALNQSITAGDELDDSSEQLSGLIQVNADVQSGDSGGPLVDATGQVIGVDTAATQQFAFQSSSGQGYAIPIAGAMAIIRQIRAGHGSSTTHVGATAFLGLLVQPSGSANGGAGPAPNGAAVSGVVSGGPAATAGLGQGDLVTALGGRAVGSSEALTRLLVPYHPGDKVAIVWTDPSGASHTATVTLASGPPA